MLIRPLVNFQPAFEYFWANYPLRAVFSKIEIFSGRAIFSSLYAGASRALPQVLAVWARTLPGQQR